MCVTYFLLAFSVGSFSSALWPAVPPAIPMWGALCAAGVASLAVRRGRRFGLLTVGLIAGVLWAAQWGERRLAAQLPPALDKSDWQLVGEVVGLPDGDRRRARFELRVLDLKPLAPVPSVPPLHRVQLSWYGQPPQLRPGQQWQLRVRLRHPRGFANPGTFDYSAWLLSRGISATGYVRDHSDNVLWRQSSGWSIDAFRWRIASRIDALPLTDPARGLLRALSVGDDGALAAQDWALLRETGTLHLVVISGLHVGLAAGLGMVLGNLLGRLPLLLGASLPARHWGAWAAWCVGGFYAALAGFGLATARAFAMLSVWLALYLLRRRALSWSGFFWALAVIALLQPLAPVTPGFWLSFGAVAALLAYFGMRPRPGRLRALVLAQWVVPLGTTVGLLGFQKEIPLLAPLVNLAAVPWVGLVSVPLALLGVATVPWAPELADQVWQWSGNSLQGFYGVLGVVHGHWGGLRWRPAHGVGWVLLVLLGVGAVCLLGPPGLGVRRYALLGLIAVVLEGPPRRPPLQVTVLDVGQGLSAVVETPDHVLVYDAGPAWSERFDAGSGIVAPYLRHQGWPKLDVLVVSHPDLDHAGGVAGLVRDYPPRRVLRGGSPAVRVEETGCRAGERWQWGRVGFRILHPADQMLGKNDRSCVLMVEAGAVRVLLPGDLESSGEGLLLAQGVLPQDIGLLIAPHHGSRTSSSSRFVARVRPRHVVYAAGYRHHFGHPHPTVVDRYAAAGAQGWHTAAEGALRFTWWDLDDPTAVEVATARRERKRYWRER